MHTVQKFVVFIIAIMCLYHGSVFAASVSKPSSELNQCQKRFGYSGNSREVFAFLPLQGDYYHGRVVIGSPDNLPGNDVLTPFNSGNITYHNTKLHQAYTLKIMAPSDSDPGSYCEDYENENNGYVEVIELAMSGSGNYVNTAGISLSHQSSGPVSCYFGADNGTNKIVMVCVYQSDSYQIQPDTKESLRQTLIELNSSALSYSQDGLFGVLCDNLVPETARAGTLEQCKSNLYDAMKIR